MVDIQSKEVIDKISEELKIQPSMKIPRELMDKIQLVYGINAERKIDIRTATLSDSTSTTILTASSTKRTFMVGATMSVSKSVLSTSINSTININPRASNGATRNLLVLRYEPVTAGEHAIFVNLTNPIELDKGSGVTLNNSNGTASIDTSGVIYFFEVDPQ